MDYLKQFEFTKSESDLLKKCVQLLVKNFCRALSLYIPCLIRNQSKNREQISKYLNLESRRIINEK